ncbi:MAG: hypothetical protein HXL38_03290 [Candidatus Saccharimonas sp.]|nr:MAG: hypothetical protein HXL38_03290 [Candidatus Saccharimonas sp.]
MENNVYKRTKILATIGPASDSPENDRKTYQRRNQWSSIEFLHGSYEEHAAKKLKQFAAKLAKS